MRGKYFSFLNPNNFLNHKIESIRIKQCPDIAHEKLRCLVPKPTRYKNTFPWPDSRSYAWFKNVPFKRLAEF
ncbi:hypothetical protein ARALYDRAFT_892701 [Arabidopsis lyrata subsp. lyrata]|uniref:Methyltransferase n=1 Tax=Arabidopsis lyrata subsp. lyrata TaxID=81972 RepID=D7KPX5_ARALL|nr:hypothetical protein ARALYDRAFT_892701 [Arabidopsis lyrata subsp. lyrata]